MNLKVHYCWYSWLERFETWFWTATGFTVADRTELWRHIWLLEWVMSFLRERIRKYLISVEFSISESVRKERCVWLKQCRRDKRWNKALSKNSVSDRKRFMNHDCKHVLNCSFKKHILGSKNVEENLYLEIWIKCKEIRHKGDANKPFAGS